MSHHLMRLTVALLFLGAGLPSFSACASSPTSPSREAVVTFRVVDEIFRVRLVTPEQIRAAEAAQAGRGPSIPIGRLRAGTDVNVGWSWHIVDVEFAEVTIELCDGRPSLVEQEGPGFAQGWYCPWGARVVSIERR